MLSLEAFFHCLPPQGAGRLAENVNTGLRPLALYVCPHPCLTVRVYSMCVCVCVYIFKLYCIAVLRVKGFCQPQTL